MARPLRRVLIGLSIHLHKSIYEVETWELPVIREYMAYMMKAPDPRLEPSRQQTPDEIEAALRANFSA